MSSCFTAVSNVYEDYDDINVLLCCNTCIYSGLQVVKIIIFNLHPRTIPGCHICAIHKQNEEWRTNVTPKGVESDQTFLPCESFKKLDLVMNT